MATKYYSCYNLYLKVWHIFYKYIFSIALIIGYFSLPKINAQELSQKAILLEQSLESIKNKYGYDQILVNGVYYEYQSGKDLGHPFLGSEDYQKGYLIIHNKRYDDLLLKYNIFDQCVVVLYIDNIGTQMAFLPPLNFISEFTIKNLIFKNYSFKDNETKIYQEVYSGEIKCLYSWKKKREESHHNIQYSAYKYFRQIKNSYLVIDNTIYQYKGNRDFIKLFSQVNKKEISNFIKTQKIKVNKSSDNEIVKLMTFCEDLISDN